MKHHLQTDYDQTPGLYGARIVVLCCLVGFVYKHVWLARLASHSHHSITAYALVSLQPMLNINFFSNSH